LFELVGEAEDTMNRRLFLLGILGAAAGGVALTSAQAAPAAGMWDDLQSLGAAAADDLTAPGA
jgi:hypothetical protein